MSDQFRTKTTTPAAKAPPFLFLKIAVLAAVMAVMYLETGEAWYLIGLGILAIPLAPIWIIPPIAFHRSHWLKADPSSETFDPDAPDTPDAVKETIHSVVPQLHDLGFKTTAHFFRNRPTPNAEGYVTLLLNHRLGQAARVGTTFVRTSRSTVTTMILGFTTDFTDGTMLATSNNDNGFPRTGLREGSMAFPEIPDPRRLFRIHEACIKRFCGDALPRDLSYVNPEQYQNESVLRITNRLIDMGYYYLDEEQQRVRPTWRGAFLLAANLRWPVKPIRTMLRRYRTRRLIRELGLEASKANRS